VKILSGRYSRELTAICTAVLIFLLYIFGPNAVWFAYGYSTKEQDIGSLKQKWSELQSAALKLPIENNKAVCLRLEEISLWLSTRGIQIDPGIADEDVEHGPFFRAVFIMTYWKWRDLFKYWIQPEGRKSISYLTSPTKDY